MPDLPDFSTSTLVTDPKKMVKNVASSFANSQTPQTVSQTGYEVPKVIPSDVLNSDTTFTDVFNQRNVLQEQESQKKGIKDLQENGVGTPSVFDDPEGNILSFLYGDKQPSALEQEVAGIRSGITRTIGGISDELDTTRSRAQREVGLSDAEKAVALTNEKIAQRQARFRREIRDFDVNAQTRGTSRAFQTDERQRIEADATAEIADLYIIQNAQQGNLDSARSYIDTAVNNRYRSIELQLAKQQADLAERIPLLEAEEKKEALKLQLALEERSRNLAIEREEAKEKRNLMITVAQNGGGDAAQRAVLNAGSLDDAIVAASPYIGLLERQAAARAASNSALQRRASLIELAKAGDQSAIKELGAFGQAILAGQENEALLAEHQRNVGITEEINNVDILLNKANALTENTVGLKTSTGTYQNVLGPAVLESIKYGPLAPTALPFTYAEVNNAKSNFLSDVSFIVENVSFDKFIDLKSQGVAFGGTSLPELQKVSNAASALSASLVINPTTGRPVSISGDEKAFNENLNIVVEGLKTAKTELQQSRLTPEEQASLLGYINTNN